MDGLYGQGRRQKFMAGGSKIQGSVVLSNTLPPPSSGETIFTRFAQVPLVEAGGSGTPRPPGAAPVYGVHCERRMNGLEQGWIRTSGASQRVAAIHSSRSLKTCLQTFACNACDMFRCNTDFVKRSVVTNFKTENACMCFIPKHVLMKHVLNETDVV